MDILQQYEKDLPQVSRQVPQWESSGEYGGLVRLVVRFSGGRIENERQANFVLIVTAVIIFGISLLIVFNPWGNTRPPPPGEMIYAPGQPPRLGPTTSPKPQQ